MNTVSFNIDIQTKEKIENFYKSYQIQNNGDYIVFFAKANDVTITIYESKKGYKVLFTGENALYEAQIFNPDARENETKVHEKIEYISLDPQIGSDEVGFGDFYGPLVVVAAYYDNSLSDIINNIKDSKKLSDEFILKFVPTILSRVRYAKLVVNNLKYNDTIKKGYNMNQMKALLHNKVLYVVGENKKDVNKFFIDQFCSEDTYFSYLSNENNIIKNITFHTKGESYFPSVALASMIARYYFLLELEKLNEKYNLLFPKGASKRVDEFTNEFIKKYSYEELINVCKTNFINYKNIKKD